MMVGDRIAIMPCSIMMKAKQKNNMSQNSITNKRGASEPVLDFMSGNTNTPAAKRLTRNIRTTHALWLLAKMAGDAGKNPSHEKAGSLLVASGCPS